MNKDLNTADNVQVAVQTQTVDSLSNAAADETLAKNFQLDSLDGQRAFVKHCIEENFVSDENFFNLRLYAQMILNLGKRPSRKDENSVHGIAYRATNDIFNMTYAKTIDNFVFNPISILLTSDGLKNYIQLCNDLKITPNYIIDDVTKSLYCCNFNNSVDVLKVALYFDENFVQKNHKYAAAPLQDNFNGKTLNSDSDILQPSDEEIKPYYDAVYKMSRGQRAALERQINLLDLRQIFPPDKNGDGFICPVCGNGSGHKGDGIKPARATSTDKNGDTHEYYFQHCFSKGDFEGTLTCIISRFNYERFSPLENEQKYLYVLAIGKFLLDKASDYKHALPPIRTISNKELDAATLSLIRADISDAQKNIDALPLDDRRGLTIETLKHFSVGYLPNWTHTKNRLEEKFFTPTPRLIIPTSDNSYNAILLKSARTDANQKWKAMNAGSKQIFNSADIVPDEIVVVVEGEIDAMSIWQASSGSVKVCATGGATQSNIKKFFDAINSADRLNYKILVLFDADKTGRTNSAKLVKDLIKLGYPTVRKFLDEGENKVDANDILIHEGDAALKSRVEQIMNAAQIELDDVKENLLNYTENEISDELPDELPDGLTDAQTIEWIKSNLDWEKRKGGKMRVSSTQRNLDLIFDYDPNIKNLIGYDEFYKQEVFLKEPLWKKNCIGDEWKNADDSHLRGYLKQTYTDYRDTESVMDNIIIYSRKNSFHPVKQCLESLHWDGVPRAETYFSKFLNADDTPYTREITRKWLLGAIARIYHEGCDFQFALVLHGKQGIGKGYCLRMLGQKWYVSLTDSLDDTHALDTIERGWIIEIAELAAGRKSEINHTKAFLSDNADTRRKAYARRAETTPRHCVFAITVNDEHFLRDLTGNRRYKIIECHSAQNEIVEGLTAEYVNQVWAEAFHIYQELFKDKFDDQLLRLSHEVDVKADEIAEKHLQDDGLQGEIAAFLDKPILPNFIWERLTKEERRTFTADGRIKLATADVKARITTQIKQATKRDSALREFSDYMSDSKNGVNGYVLKEGYGDTTFYFYGTVDRESTCAAEVFNECFGNDRRKNTNRINEVLASLEGWKREDKRSKNFSTVYGQQRFYYARNTENPHHDSTFAKRIDALFDDGN